MVNVLWSAGNVTATIALERLWNQLARIRSFTLLCGYALDKFDSQEDAAFFRDVCAEHSLVLPAESYETIEDRPSQLRFVAELQQKALALQREVEQNRQAQLALQKANEELRKAKEQAEAASQAKSVFLANMSHEIRTPLSAVIGFAELLLEPEVPSQERIETAKIIVTNGQHLTRLVSDILDHSKVESGKLEMERIRFDLVDLVSEVDSLLGLMAREKGIAWKVTWDGCVRSVSIVSDPVRLRQILLNIAGNAIKFTEKGIVELAMRLQDSLLECTVSDTGCGLSPAQTERLFQPFSQGDSSMSRQYGGSGLGLVLSRQLARLLGGDVILVSSSSGTGSTFRITINAGDVEKQCQSSTAGSLFQTPPTSPLSTPASSPLPNLALQYPLSILVVDDNAVNRHLIARILARMGYTDVILSKDGEEAVRSITSHPRDLVLMDVHMPKMDGLAACKAIRQLCQPLRAQPIIIALTASVTQAVKDSCLACGMDDHLGKPIDISTLLQKLIHWAKVAVKRTTCQPS
jgi:signal transduction histidine kinase/ActR/RegA family two-component response regulator